MNAVRRERNHEVDVANTEATEARLDALRDNLDDVKKDVRELRGDVKSLRDHVDGIRTEMHSGFASLRGEMHAGFTALRESIAGVEKSVAALQGTMRTLLWGAGIFGALAILFLTAGKTLHWFEAAARPDASAATRESTTGNHETLIPEQEIDYATSPRTSF